MTDEKVPATTEQPEEEERSWRDVAQSWKRVGKAVKDLGDRLGSAFKEGWETEELDETDTKDIREKLRALGDRLDRAVESARGEAKDPRTKAHAKATVQATKEASTAFMEELQETLSEGLEEVNKKVDELLEKRRKKEGGESSEA